MLPKNFLPEKEYELVRLGKDNDGGYLVEKNSLINAKSLISFGIANDWSFEKDFMKIKNCPIHCYDPFVKYSQIKKFSRKKIINFFKILNFFKKDYFKKTCNQVFLYKDYKKFFSGKVIHFQNSIGIGINKIEFSDVIKKINNFPLFLKVDIEGSEYRILDEIIQHQNKISGLIIEFHNLDINRNIVSNFINKFELSLCHVHGQNLLGKEFLDKNNDPIQIEMTFSNSHKFINSKPKIPHPLDHPADQRFKEINLNFED